MKDFNITDFLNELNSYNELNEQEKELEDLRSAVQEYKEWKAAKNMNNTVKRMDAVKRSDNSCVDKYVAMCNKKSKEFRENYF